MACDCRIDVQEFASRILAANVRWAERLNQTFPEYFPDSHEKQRPKILWIGCSDSRMQESDAIVALPGTAFVHRNIANQFHLDDDNALSVLAYALKALATQHVIVVGHEHCGGAISAMNAARQPPNTDPAQPKRHHTLQDSLYHVVEELLHHEHPDADVHDEASKDPNDAITRWLTPLTERVRELCLPKDKEEALKIVVEENVRMQVENLTGRQIRAFVRRSVKRTIWVHGWVYDFSTGFIRDLQITKVIGVEDD